MVVRGLQRQYGSRQALTNSVTYRQNTRIKSVHRMFQWRSGAPAAARPAASELFKPSSQAWSLARLVATRIPCGEESLVRPAFNLVLGTHSYRRDPKRWSGLSSPSGSRTFWADAGPDPEGMDFWFECGTISAT